MMEKNSELIYPDPNREIYPNPMLKDANFEMRFYPLLDIDLYIIDFQKELREDLPIFKRDKIYKKDPGDETVSEIISHSFKSERNDMKLTITNSTLSFVALKYTRYEDFKGMIIKFTSKFLKKFDLINQLVFVGMRYINTFELKHEDTTLEKITEYFNSGVEKEHIVSKKIEDFYFSAIYWDKKRRVKIDFMLNNDTINKMYRIKLDIDSNSPNTKLPTENLSKELDNLHKNIKIVFENSITDKLRNDTLRVGDDVIGE